MSNKEQYSKAMANVIRFDNSETIVTFSNQCYGNIQQKHNKDCTQIFSSNCGEEWYDNKAYLT